MADAEPCAYEIFDGGPEVDNIPMEEKVKGCNMRGKNYTVSQDGLCPRCGNSNKLYVILDKLFPMGDMPEILHSLIAKGKAILWSSQEREGFKDPPTFLCRGFCPSDPLGAGFNVNWDNVSLNKILESLDRPVKAPILPSSQQENSEQDGSSMHHESSDRSWLVLDECDDERSDIEKRFSETSLNQSSSDKEREEETEEDEDDDDDDLDEEELIKQMLAKEQQKLEQENDDNNNDDVPLELAASMEQSSLTLSNFIVASTVTSSMTTAATTAATGSVSTSTSAKSQYPISKDGQCPYCQSTDVKYIIVVSDTTKDTDLPHSLQQLLTRNHAFKMAKGTSEPPSFQCQKCQYGFNIDWCKTNLEVIFGLPSPTSSLSTSTSTSYKPTSAPYHRPPAPYWPHHTTYHPANVPPPRYPPPVGGPPPTHLSTYHPYPPTYPGYYGYYPPAPIPPPHVPYPGYPLPGIPPPGVPPLGYVPPGVPPIPPHSVPPPNPWGAIPNYPGMYPAHPPQHCLPPPSRGYHLPPAGRPWPPSPQYPSQPRPPPPWHQRPGPPAPMAAEPVQDESTPAPDTEAEKSKVVAARFELLLNQIDQAKARVRYEKELIKEFHNEMASNANEQPSHEEEEPNALTDEGQKSAHYDEKPPGDDSQADQGDVYLGFGSVVTINESQSGDPGKKNDAELTMHEGTKEPSSFPLQSDTHNTSGDSSAVSRESGEGIPCSARNTTKQPSDDALSFADGILQACAQSDVETYESSQSSVVLESEHDSQTLSTDGIPSSSEPSTRDSRSVDTLPRRGRRSVQPRKSSESPVTPALESPRQTRRSWRTACSLDTDSSATEEESLPLGRRLRKSRRNKLSEKKEAKTVAKGFDQVNDRQVGIGGSDMETKEALDVVCQHSKTESDSETLLSSGDQFVSEAEAISEIICHESVTETPFKKQSVPKNIVPEPPIGSPYAPETLSEDTCLEAPNPFPNDPDIVSEDMSPVAPDQRGRKTRGRKRKQQASDREGLVSVSATRKSPRVSATGGTAEGHSKEEGKKEVEDIQTESEEESSASTQRSEEASSMKRFRARRSQRVPASVVQRSRKDVLERHDETGDALPEESETQHQLTAKDNLETESYLQTLHSNSVKSISESKIASKVIHPEDVNQSPSEPKTVFEVIPRKARKQSPIIKELAPEGMLVETPTQFSYGADTPLEVTEPKTSNEYQHGSDTSCEHMHPEAPNKPPHKPDPMLQGMPSNQPHSEPEIASDHLSPVVPQQHGKTRGRKRKQQGFDREGPASAPATRRSARISTGEATAEEHSRQESKKGVENISGESGERSCASTQDNEGAFFVRSPMERRSQVAPVDEFQQPDDISHNALRNSLEMSQEPETSEQITNPSIHRTRRSPLSQEPKTQETKEVGTSRLTEEVVLTPQDSEAYTVVKVTRTFLDVTQPDRRYEEEQISGTRNSGALKLPEEIETSTRTSAQLSLQEPGSSETDDNSITAGKRKSVRLVLQEPQLLHSEDKSIGRRKRKSVPTSAQQPESLETEDNSNRRQTRNFTRDTLIHEKKPADKQQAFTAFEKESNAPFGMEEDKTLQQTRKTSSEMTQGTPSSDEDLHLSQSSDTLNAKAEVSSHQQTMPRTRKSRKSSGVPNLATKASEEVESSEGRVCSRRTRSITKSTSLDKEVVDVSRGSDCLTSVEDTEEESPGSIQGMFAGNIEETTRNVTKRITRSRRKKNP